MYSNRLNMILQYVNGKVVADIGTDHAFVPIKLIDENICEKVIATDVNKGPLKSAESNIIKHCLSDKIELRLGSGLLPLSPDECDTIIIAGMGGELICKILSEGETVARSSECLILQPMNAQNILRKFLNENGYKIVCEDITVEGFKVYNLLVVKDGGVFCESDEFSYHLPEDLYKHNYFDKLLLKKKREFTKILNGLTTAQNADYDKIEKYRLFLDKICDLEKKIN